MIREQLLVRSCLPAHLLVAVMEPEPPAARGWSPALELAAVATAIFELPVAIHELPVLPCSRILSRGVRGLMRMRKGVNRISTGDRFAAKLLQTRMRKNEDLCGIYPATSFDRVVGPCPEFQTAKPVSLVPISIWVFEGPLSLS
jgi:hypothetical protein